MTDPVCTIDGHSYERTAIAEVLKEAEPLSPLTREPLAPGVLIPNIALRQRIDRHADAELRVAEAAAAGAAAGEAARAALHATLGRSPGGTLGAMPEGDEDRAARAAEPACSCMGAHWLLQALYTVARSNATDAGAGAGAAVGQGPGQTGHMDRTGLAPRTERAHGSYGSTGGRRRA